MEQLPNPHSRRYVEVELSLGNSIQIGDYILSVLDTDDDQTKFLVEQISADIDCEDGSFDSEEFSATIPR